jgi:phosphatidylinositol-3,4,5-trisphosphate 3-phosphatase and dual-specificity protein phosphatase PTEN
MNFLRELVSGNKSRYKEGDFNLDLTYITNRIIAMAFPASGLESFYRNSIDDVKKLIESRHSYNYLIINLSDR